MKLLQGVLFGLCVLSFFSLLLSTIIAAFNGRGVEAACCAAFLFMSIVLGALVLGALIESDERDNDNH